MTSDVLVVWTRDRPRALAAITVTLANRRVDLRWLTVSHDTAPGLLCITLGVGASTPGGIELLHKRLNRLVDVVKVFVMTEGTAHVRQGVLIKLAIAPNERSPVLDIGRAFAAELVEVSATTITLALQARPSEIASLHEALSTFHVVDVMPLGLAAIPVGGRAARPNSDSDGVASAAALAKDARERRRTGRKEAAQSDDSRPRSWASASAGRMLA